jgi:hypothetical protein
MNGEEIDKTQGSNVKKMSKLKRFGFEIGPLDFIWHLDFDIYH